MQKNIVFGVNAAMATQGAKAAAKQPEPITAPIIEDGAIIEDVATLQNDMQQLKEENSQFAATVDEMKKQNEELQEKIEQLLAAAIAHKDNAKAPEKKKKKTKKKAKQ